MKTLLLSVLCINFLMFSYSMQAKELRVGLAELDYPPFYFEKEGKFSGAALEIAQTLATKLDHKLVYSRFPWKRLQAYLNTGKIDMVILYFKTPEREKDAIYTDIPHIYESSDLFVVEGTNYPYKGALDDLLPYKFGGIRGYSYGNEYDNSSRLLKQEVSNEELLIRILIHGRVDIAVGNKPAIIMHAEKLGLRDKIRFLNPPIDVGGNYMAFSRKRKGAQELAEEFSKELKVFITTSAYRDILIKYNFDVHEYFGQSWLETNDFNDLREGL